MIRAEHPAVKIIAISGCGHGPWLRVASLLGARCTLSKPFTGDAIAAAVRQVLSAEPTAA